MPGRRQRAISSTAITVYPAEICQGVSAAPAAACSTSRLRRALSSSTSRVQRAGQAAGQCLQPGMQHIRSWQTVPSEVVQTLQQKRATGSSPLAAIHGAAQQQLAKLDKQPAPRVFLAIACTTSICGGALALAKRLVTLATRRVPFLGRRVTQVLHLALPAPLLMPLAAAYVGMATIQGMQQRQQREQERQQQSEQERQCSRRSPFAAPTAALGQQPPRMMVVRNSSSPSSSLGERRSFSSGSSSSGTAQEGAAPVRMATGIITSPLRSPSRPLTPEGLLAPDSAIHAPAPTVMVSEARDGAPVAALGGSEGAVSTAAKAEAGAGRRRRARRSLSLPDAPLDSLLESPGDAAAPATPLGGAVELLVSPSDTAAPATPLGGAVEPLGSPSDTAAPATPLGGAVEPLGSPSDTAAPVAPPGGAVEPLVSPSDTAAPVAPPGGAVEPLVSPGDAAAPATPLGGAVEPLVSPSDAAAPVTPLGGAVEPLGSPSDAAAPVTLLGGAVEPLMSPSDAAAPVTPLGGAVEPLVSYVNSVEPIAAASDAGQGRTSLKSFRVMIEAEDLVSVAADDASELGASADGTAQGGSLVYADPAAGAAARQGPSQALSRGATAAAGTAGALAAGAAAAGAEAGAEAAAGPSSGWHMETYVPHPATPLDALAPTEVLKKRSSTAATCQQVVLQQLQHNAQQVEAMAELPPVVARLPSGRGVCRITAAAAAKQALAASHAAAAAAGVGRAPCVAVEGAPVGIHLVRFGSGSRCSSQGGESGCSSPSHSLSPANSIVLSCPGGHTSGGRSSHLLSPPFRSPRVSDDSMHRGVALPPPPPAAAAAAAAKAKALGQPSGVLGRASSGPAAAPSSQSAAAASRPCLASAIPGATAAANGPEDAAAGPAAGPAAESECPTMSPTAAAAAAAGPAFPSKQTGPRPAVAAVVAAIEQQQREAAQQRQREARSRGPLGRVSPPQPALDRSSNPLDTAGSGAADAGPLLSRTSSSSSSSSSRGTRPEAQVAGIAAGLYLLESDVARRRSEPGNMRDNSSHSKERVRHSSGNSLAAAAAARVRLSNS